MQSYLLTVHLYPLDLYSNVVYRYNIHVMMLVLNDIDLNILTLNK